ncbi:MAG: hypothetical protein ACR2GG_08045 [Gemmatimonadaceae bacterium]
MAATAAGVVSDSPTSQATHNSIQRPTLAPARNSDQAFLRRLLDHHEGVIAAAHAAMMSTGGHMEHGSNTDPAEFDGVLDAEKIRMLALLDSLYGEKFSPAAYPVTDSTPAATSQANRTMLDKTASPEADEMRDMIANRKELVHRLREGIALIDRYRPTLRTPQVKTLADKARANDLILLRKAQQAVSSMAPIARMQSR